MLMKQKIRTFILENYLFTEDETQLTDDQSLMDTGIIDSTGVLELIMFIEETFGIKVKDDEMVPANLDSVLNVTTFIGRKLVSAG